MSTAATFAHPAPVLVDATFATLSKGDRFLLFRDSALEYTHVKQGDTEYSCDAEGIGEAAVIHTWPAHRMTALVHQIQPHA